MIKRTLVKKKLSELTEFFYKLTFKAEEDGVISTYYCRADSFEEALKLASKIEDEHPSYNKVDQKHYFNDETLMYLVSIEMVDYYIDTSKMDEPSIWQGGKND